MKNKVYYGEYTLKHWIELLLDGNVILPPYQRVFVWSKEKVKKLVESLQGDFFVPPIVIGAYKSDEKIQNLIIDGQQRLTSLLLAYLNVFPNKDSFEPKSEDATSFADENDDSLGGDDDDGVLGWTFNDLLKMGQSKRSILEKINSGNRTYENLMSSERSFPEELFESHYLGFAYLLPQNEQVKYFSSVFRDINTEGKSLTKLESRRSLYYLTEGIEKFFDPDCVRKITVKKDSGIERIDFVRYLAFLFQYEKIGSINDVAKKYGKKFEEYYELFIYNVINKVEDSIFRKYEEKYKERITNLEKSMRELVIADKEFISIIDADIYLFGLIYHTILKGKSFDMNKRNELVNKLKCRVEELKNDPSDGNLHKKNPAALKYLRRRIEVSVSTYKIFLK